MYQANNCVSVVKETTYFGFEVITAVTTKSTIVRYVWPCGMLKLYGCFAVSSASYTDRATATCRRS
jgi:hypothetical protein